jgi:uncharacterized protein YlxW (UPF0749 family)
MRTVSEQTLFRLSIAGALSLLSVVATAAVVWAGDHHAVARHEEEIQVLSEQVRALQLAQKEIEVIKANVTSSKTTLEDVGRRVEWMQREMMRRGAAERNDR